MGDRIEEGYREKLRSLLASVPSRPCGRRLRWERGVDLLLARARSLSRRQGIDGPRALACVFEGVRKAASKRLPSSPPADMPPRFVCDAHMGGLARWLRAAGYEAFWMPEIEDGPLVEEARQRAAVLITGDVGILKRRVVREGTVATLWVPSCLGRFEQLSMVMRELGLSLREPRCMACGGRLEVVDKDAVADRIPPRTARWKNEYTLCGACGKLFWRGTHWEKIAVRLARAEAASGSHS